MVLNDIITMLNGIKIDEDHPVPFTYRSFPVGSAPGTPFICYLLDSVRPEAADNAGIPISTLSIELYTDSKDFALESKVEAVLDSNEMVWSKEEVWIDDERMQMTTYEMEVYVNGFTE